MVERQPLTPPLLSDLPGRIGEQGKLFRFFKGLCAEIGELWGGYARLSAENDLLREANGCLQERLAALEDRFQKHCANQQMGAL